jgi:NAD(P)-dependent dehydrogenase (short-subunit alcohol dehydrogenase family)
MNYTGKTVLITGGSKGIGEGCVRTFVAAGSNVVFCARHEAAGKALAEELNSRGKGHKNSFVAVTSKGRGDRISRLSDR